MPQLMGLGIGSVPWNPSQLGGSLKAWWRADLGVTATGPLVDQWDDLSGNGKHLTSMGAGRPTYNASGFGGLPSIDFSGGQWMQVAYALAQPLVWFFAMNNTGSTADFRQANDGTTVGARQIVYADAGTGIATLFAGAAIQAAAETLAGDHVVTGVFDGANSALRRDGLQIAAGNGGAQGIVGVTIGSQFGLTGQYWVGPMAEVLVCSALSLGSIQSVERYLGRRYGVVVA